MRHTSRQGANPILKGVSRKKPWVATGVLYYEMLLMKCCLRKPVSFLVTKAQMSALWTFEDALLAFLYFGLFFYKMRILMAPAYKFLKNWITWSAVVIIEFSSIIQWQAFQNLLVSSYMSINVSELGDGNSLIRSGKVLQGVEKEDKRDRWLSGPQAALFLKHFLNICLRHVLLASRSEVEPVTQVCSCQQLLTAGALGLACVWEQMRICS